MAAAEGKAIDDPRIIIEDGVCKLADRSALAGSIATMDQLVRTMVKADIPLADAIRMLLRLLPVLWEFMTVKDLSRRIKMRIF